VSALSFGKAGVAGALLLLSACGAQQRLTPAAGESLPPKPALAPTQPSAPDLLARPAPTRPGRSDELVTRSDVRPEDRFELPPR
jgi:hypothetical protein